jgi:hypothetical protein
LGTAGAWAAANYHGPTGSSSVIGTLSATWQITGVQLEPGSVATPFERRSFGAELALCQRYYEVVSIKGQPGYANPQISAGVVTVVPKQAAPTVTFRDGSGNVSRIDTQVSGANQTMSSAPSLGSPDFSRLIWDFSTGANIGFWWAGIFVLSSEL